MKPLVFLFLAPALWGQQAQGLSQPFTSPFGQDSFPSLELAPTGRWEGLLLSVTEGAAATVQKPKASKRRRQVPEATVEVWDFAYQEPPAQETFRLFREQLLLSIRSNWRFAPPSHGRIDLAIRGGGTAGMGSDMAMVQSLQQRFNRLPPSGSPVLLGN
jgi:hypothetical protein